MKVILGKKVGMTQVYNENGTATPVTVLDVSANIVSKYLGKEKVSHYEIGKDTRKKSSKADKGNYKDVNNVVPRFKFAVKLKAGETAPELGSKVEASTFVEGDKVQVTGVTKGKGFQGVVKRWRFHGGPRTHGASDRERAPGSIGTRTIPGRVFKGKKMGGYMGNRNKTIQGLKIIQVMPKENLIAVEGSLPGAKNSYVIIKE